MVQLLQCFNLLTLSFHASQPLLTFVCTIQYKCFNTNDFSKHRVFSCVGLGGHNPIPNDEKCYMEIEKNSLVTVNHFNLITYTFL